MDTIDGFDELKGRHPGFELWHLQFVEDLHLFRPDEPEAEALPFSLVLTMRTDGPSPLHVRMLFGGVAGLRFDPWNDNLQIDGFGIGSVADRGWEHCRWEVSDFEHHVIRFFCRSASLEELDATHLGQVSG